MADARANANKAKEAGKQELPACGVIMPISETASHTEAHWQAVQTLLHRAIVAAGFEPRNVWESTATDRISERIIGNIFQVPLAVADITDLNPNVMLELGLRLASRKPTVVIATTGSMIPFDIRDFHATFYPPDMNMLGMEDFFRRIARVLQEKHRAFVNEAYTPFLGSVIVDVVSPETREVGANDIILSRLDEIARRLVSVENVSRQIRLSPASRVRASGNKSGKISASVPEEYVQEFVSEAGLLFEVDGYTLKEIKDGKRLIEFSYSGADGYLSMDRKLSDIAVKFGGDTEVPF